MSNIAFSRLCHCGTSLAGARTRRRLTLSLAISGIRISPASMVLPRPTSSATSQRKGQRSGDLSADPQLMRQDLNAGAREDSPLVVNRSDREGLGPQHCVAGIGETGTTNRGGEAGNRRERGRLNALQPAAEVLRPARRR